MNGQLKNSTTIPVNFTINNVGSSLLIGRYGAGLYTNATFDDLAIYRRSLSTEEVLQLYQRSGPLCKTCDYRIEFTLHKTDDPDYVHPGLPAPYDIRAGECSEQATLAWNPAAFQLTGLSAGVNYVLEKRITINTVNPLTQKTYLQEHEEQLRTYYEGEASTTLTTINNFIISKDLAGLRTHLEAILLPGAGPLLSIWLRPYHQAPTSVGASFFGHCRRICMAAFPIARLCRGLRSPITGTTSSVAFVAPLLQGQMLRLMTLWPCPSPRAGPFCFHGQSCPDPGKFCRLFRRTKPPSIDFSAFSGGTPFA
jgi:hypothetical protein